MKVLDKKAYYLNKGREYLLNPNNYAKILEEVSNSDRVSWRESYPKVIQKHLSKIHPCLKLNKKLKIHTYSGILTRMAEYIVFETPKPKKSKWYENIWKWLH